MPTAYTQRDFSGGMNLFDLLPNIGENQYGLAFNIRNRNNCPQPIRAAVEDDTLPVGKKQGIYAFDVFILAFVNGGAYYKNIVTSSDWTKINGFSLSPTVDYIYAQAVPASRFNYDRQLKSSNQAAGTTGESAINVLPVKINGSPYGLVVQDGVNQGYLITPDGNARVLQRYDEWTISNREYVPKLKQMAYMEGILFGISAEDGKTLFRSVSGRPLDFVVNVDVNGNKGGDATTTAHAVGFDEITCIRPLPNGKLLLATQKSLVPVELDYENTIFGEPRFRNPTSISAGVVNHFSFVDYLRSDGYSDSYFVDTDGLRSYNAAEIQGNEGRNSSFTTGIKLALVSKQTISSAIVFDDYSLFSISSIHNEANNLVAIFDNLRNQWVCFDDYGIGSIKQFAIANQSTSPILYAITENKLYRLFASNESAEASMKFKSITTGDGSVQLQLFGIRSVFINSNSAGIVSATAEIDEQETDPVQVRLRGISKVENIRFNFKHISRVGYTISPEITWQNDCKLQLIQIDATANSQETSIKQQSSKFIPE